MIIIQPESLFGIGGEIGGNDGISFSYIDDSDFSIVGGGEKTGLFGWVPTDTLDLWEDNMDDMDRDFKLVSSR